VVRPVFACAWLVSGDGRHGNQACGVLRERVCSRRRNWSPGCRTGSARARDGVDPDVLAAFAGLLPAAAYLPMLLRVTPRLVTPAAEDDYVARERVAT
jgi:hypothetical protein